MWLPTHSRKTEHNRCDFQVELSKDPHPRTLPLAMAQGRDKYGRASTGPLAMTSGIPVWSLWASQAGWRSQRQGIQPWTGSLVPTLLMALPTVAWMCQGWEREPVVPAAQQPSPPGAQGYLTVAPREAQINFLVLRFFLKESFYGTRKVISLGTGTVCVHGRGKSSNIRVRGRHWACVKLPMGCLYPITTYWSAWFNPGSISDSSLLLSAHPGRQQ